MPAQPTIQTAPTAADLSDQTGFNSMAAQLESLMSNVTAESKPSTPIAATETSPKPDTKTQSVAGTSATANASPATRTASTSTSTPGTAADTQAESHPEASPTAGTTSSADTAQTETKPDLEADEPTGLSVKASTKFNTLRKSRDEWRLKYEVLEQGELKQLRQEIQQYRTSKPAVELELLKKERETLAQQRDALARERDELNKVVQVKAVEHHPKFKAYFGAKIDSATAIAKSIVGPGLSDRVERTLKLADGPARDTALEEIVSELPAMKANEFLASLVELRKIHHERNAELARAGEHAATLEAEQQAEQTRRQESFQAEVSKGIQLAEQAASHFDGFKPIDGDDKHNAEVANRRQFIKEFFSGNVKKEFIPMIPVMIGDYLHYKNNVVPSLGAKIATLEKQLQQLQSATPKADGGRAAKPTAADNQVNPEESFTANYRRLMGR